jgi:hypothetical protein
MLTIGLGVLIHVLRVIFGDDFAMRYVVTPTTDKILLVPMTYAATTGILLLVQLVPADSRVPGVPDALRQTAI